MQVESAPGPFLDLTTLAANNLYFGLRWPALGILLLLVLLAFRAGTFKYLSGIVLVVVSALTGCSFLFPESLLGISMLEGTLILGQNATHTTHSGLVVTSSTLALCLMACFTVSILGFSIFLKRIKGSKDGSFEQPSPGFGISMLLLMGMLLGTLLCCLTVDWIEAFIGLELVSVCSYFLIAISFNKPTAEAALKYFLYGGVSAAFTIYGISWHYIDSHALLISAPNIMATGTSSGSGSNLHYLSHGLIIIGMLFKLGSVPMHFWVGSVYQSAKPMVLAIIAIVPKIAALGVFITYFMSVPSGFHDLNIEAAIAFLAIAGITLGNVAALRQDSMRLLLGFSGVAQAGFMLIGILNSTHDAGQSLVLYLAVYIVATIAAWLLLDSTNAEDRPLTTYKGLGRKDPLQASLWLLILLSFAGLPPLAGFQAKFGVFLGLANTSGFIAGALPAKILLVGGLLNTAFAIYYYLKLPYYAFFFSADKGKQMPKLTFSNLAIRLLIIAFVSSLVLGFAFPTIFKF